MNTETLVNSNTKDIQPSNTIELKAQAAGKKEAERAHCGDGVCEVVWKPFPKSKQRRGKNKPVA